MNPGFVANYLRASRGYAKLSRRLIAFDDTRMKNVILNNKIKKFTPISPRFRPLGAPSIITLDDVQAHLQSLHFACQLMIFFGGGELLTQ
jgi:hypothetical protein